MKITLWYKDMIENVFDNVVYFETKDKALEIFTEEEVVDQSNGTKQLLFSSVNIEPAHTRLEVNLTGYYEGLLKVLKAQVKQVNRDINFDKDVVQKADYSGEHTNEEEVE